MYPEGFQKIINDLKLLPGVGEKTAVRYAFSLLKMNEEKTTEIAEDLINLKNNIVYTFNKNQGFTSIAHVDILNTNTNSLNEYSFKGSIKSLFTNEEKLAINTGSEVHFIGLNGWLIKKYDSYSEINNVILGDSIAGIVCKDKIKILEI